MKTKINTIRAYYIDSFYLHRTTYDYLIVKIPDLEMKAKVLNDIPSPDFEHYHYLNIEDDILFKSSKNTRISDDHKCHPKYFRIRKSDVISKTYDKNFLELEGDYNRPMTFWSPSINQKHEVIPFVIYNHDGTLIKNSLMAFLEEISDRTSPLSVVKLYKWKKENPSKDNWRTISFKTRIEYLIQILEKTNHKT